MQFRIFIKILYNQFKITLVSRLIIYRYQTTNFSIFIAFECWLVESLFQEKLQYFPSLFRSPYFIDVLWEMPTYDFGKYLTFYLSSSINQRIKHDTHTLDGPIQSLWQNAPHCLQIIIALTSHAKGF